MQPLDILYQYVSNRIAVTDEQWDIVRACVSVRTFQRKEIIWAAGDACRYGLFVAKGCLRSYVLDEKGKEHVLYFAPENWWMVDNPSLLQSRPSLFFADAIEPTECLVFDKRAFENVMMQFDQTKNILITLLQNNLSTLQRRLIFTLSRTAQERYLDFVQTYPDLVQRVPQRMIASYIGVTPEFLSRIRQDLATKK